LVSSTTDQSDGALGQTDSNKSMMKQGSVHEDEEVKKRQTEQNELDRKNKVKATIMKLFTQTKVGCKKDVCYNQYCWKNLFCKITNH